MRLRKSNREHEKAGTCSHRRKWQVKTVQIMTLLVLFIHGRVASAVVFPASSGWLILEFSYSMATRVEKVSHGLSVLGWEVGYGGKE